MNNANTNNNSDAISEQFERVESIMTFERSSFLSINYELCFVFFGAHDEHDEFDTSAVHRSISITHKALGTNVAVAFK